ncbi:MAG: hypothetical protein ACSLFB_10235 [Acidimicrobiales bacterium]
MKVRSVLHLVRRFFGALHPGDAGPENTAWALNVMLPGEQALWRQMSKPDQRHSAGVARKVEHAIGEGVERPVLAAALLHDVGKLEANLGTWARVVATLVGLIVGKGRTRRWIDRGSGPMYRLGIYHAHPERGAALLTFSGSDPLTIAWARQHHLPPDRWTVDPLIGHVLKNADDD